VIRASLAENLLRCFCEFAAAYVLLFQAIGLVNLFAGRPLFNRSMVLVCAGGLLAGLALRCRPAIVGRSFPRVPFRLASLMLGSTYLLFLAEALISYPDGYDPISYHLPKALSWLQSPRPLLTDFKWQMALPANAELFTLPALALNLQNLVFWGNLLATGILGLSVYVIARRLSASREASAFSCAIVLSIPIVVFQAFYLDTDAFATAFVLAALAFLLIFLHDDRSGAVVLCALCAGVSIGNKQVFVPYAGLVLCLAILTVVKRKQPALVPLVIAAGLAPSALWICRNWMSTGNPFFPFPIRLLGLSLPGATGYGFNFTLQVRAAGVLAYGSIVAPISEFKGVGAAFSTFAIAGLGAAVIESFRTRRTMLAVTTALTIVVGTGWWVAVHIVRFGLPVLALIVVFCAILYEKLLPRHRAIARALLTGGVALTCVLCLQAPATTAMHRFRAHDGSRAAYYGYPAMVDRLPAGTTILDRSHDGNMGFALAGQGLQNRIVHLVGQLTPAELMQPTFDYAAISGPANGDDPLLAQFGDLVYDGLPATIFPKTASVWRIYKMGHRRP
jgi:hypothetical protein